MSRIEEKIDNIEIKIDNLHATISDIKVTMAENTGSLKEHMARTAAAEQALDILKKEFKPVKDHVVFVNNVIKFIAVFSSVLLFLKSMGIL